jgi:GT2 family glycosyltransferase
MTPSTSDHPPRVSAVVVVYNPTTERVERCLRALRASTGVQLEIVVVDNDSSIPVTNDLADRMVRRADNGGFAAGVNDGIEVATGDWIAVVNDDAVVHPAMLQRCIHAIEQGGPTVVAAAPKVLFAGTDGDFIDSCGLVVRPNGEAFSAGAGQPDLGQFDHDPVVLGPCLSAAVFRADAFQRVGMLDERYFLYYEDVDWALRSYLSGHTTVFVPQAIAHHEHAASTRSVGERNRFRMVQRNLLVCATTNLSIRAATRVWAGRSLAGAKAAVKGPDRTSLLAALAAATVRAPAALWARRSRRRRAVLPDEAAFAFAEGLTPYVDTHTYRPTDLAAATRAAHARQARAGRDR